MYLATILNMMNLCDIERSNLIMRTFHIHGVSLKGQNLFPEKQLKKKNTATHKAGIKEIKMHDFRGSYATNLSKNDIQLI